MTDTTAEVVVLAPDFPIVTVEVPGPQGVPGGFGVAYFEHVQSTPASEWVIVHGMARLPVVSIIIDGVEVDASVVEHIDNNTVRVEFPTPQSGKAVFS